MKNLALEAKTVLIQLIDMLYQLNYDEYTEKIGLLTNSTIGEHTRHVIELFQQLSKGYETGIVDYDNRKRNIQIQQNIDYAVECIAHIISNLEREDKPLLLKTAYNCQATLIASNYFREVMYNVEHCIHHQAIIKIAFLSLGKNDMDKNFGVAKSTILYREKCVQ